MGAASTPAGWYPDVERPGGERYWNGSSWTEDRRPGPVQGFPAGPPPSSGPAMVPDGYAPYGAQAPQYPGNGLAGWGLALSIFGLFCCGGVLCVPGAIMGWVHLQRIKRGERDPGSSGLGLAALIVGAIGTLLLGLAVLFLFIGLVSAT